MEHCGNKKTDILRDWMNRDMAVSPSSSSCSSSATSCDNNSQVHDVQQQPCLPSLKSFLLLPQLPVNGDDGVDEDASTFRHHYPRQCDMQQRTRQPPSSSAVTSPQPLSTNLTTKSSSIRTCSNRNPFPPSDYKNDGSKNGCQKKLQSVEKSYSRRITTTTSISDGDDDDDTNSSNNKSDRETSFPCKSSFSFIAANDPVIDCSSSAKSNNTDESYTVGINGKSEEHEKRKFSTSSSPMSIFIKGNPPNNGNHNYNHSPFCFAANHPHSHLHRYPHQNHRHHCRRRLLIFRICQAFSVLICTAFLLNLVKNSIWAKDEGPDSLIPPTSLSSLASSRLQHRLIQSWNMPSIIIPPSPLSTFKAPDILSNLASSNSLQNDSNILNLSLLDVPNFKFLMNNKTKCNIHRDDDNYIDGDEADRPTNNDGGANTTIFFMIIVHSAPQNFQERQAIRETWGSLQRLGQFHIRLVFLLGQALTANAGADRKNDITSSNHVGSDKDGKKFDGKTRSTFYSKLQRESQQHGDIVTGNFHDSYRNLTYKHLMGYLWVLNHCAHAKYVLKADDDAFIDIFQLFKFVKRTFGEDPEAALICNVFPQGTKPVRRTDKQGKKWAVTYEEYPYKEYPKFCSGVAYLATPNVIREIYEMSGNLRKKFLWIDDVFVTGILREMAHVEPFYLNLRYSYDPEEYRKWLLSRGGSAKNNNNDEEINEDSGFTENEDRKIEATAAASAPVVLSNEMKNEGRRSTPPQKIPFMIVHLERGLSLGREMRELWNCTWDVWSESGLIV